MSFDPPVVTGLNLTRLQCFYVRNSLLIYLISRDNMDAADPNLK